MRTYATIFNQDKYGNNHRNQRERFAKVRSIHKLSAECVRLTSLLPSCEEIRYNQYFVTDGKE